MDSKTKIGATQGAAKRQHTPGPWSVNEDALTVEAGDITVCTVEPADKGAIFLVSHEVTEANAHLIAAAPELLEACQLLVADYESENPAIGDDWYRKAKAAIAQATGGAL